MFSACRDKADWTQMTSFRLYDDSALPPNKDIRDFTDSELETMKFAEADLRKAIAVLSAATPANQEMHLWKGEHFALATFQNGQRRRIRICWYSSFFTDLTDGQQYRFEGESDREWKLFLSEI